MNIKDWATREVELACKRERKSSGVPEGEWDYGCACYEAALKAYQVLIEEKHNWGMTRRILMRLLNGKPLTPIEEDAEIWDECGHSNKDCISYQCNRMTSLFKDVYTDGTVKYSDVDRCYGIEINQSVIAYNTRMIREIVDEMFPITMPYSPEEEKYEVASDTISVCSEDGELEMRAVLYIVDPEGNCIEVNRYFENEVKAGRD